MIFRRLLPTLAFAAWSALACLPASATVTAFFSAGTTCQGQPVVKFKAGGPEVKVALCMSATEESICGHSIQLEAESAASSGRFLIVGHKVGENYPDPTLEKLPAAVAVTHPPSPHDFGGTRDGPFAPAANQLLVLFTLRPLETAKDRAYTIRLGKNSLVSVGTRGNCLEVGEARLSATMRLERN